MVRRQVRVVEFLRITKLLRELTGKLTSPPMPAPLFCAVSHRREQEWTQRPDQEEAKHSWGRLLYRGVRLGSMNVIYHQCKVQYLL